MSYREVILHNFWLKLISLGLASLIWVGVRYQIQSEYPSTPLRTTHVVATRTLKVRIAIISSGEGRAFRVSPREAQVTLLGEEALKLSPTNVLVYVDLSDFNSKVPVQQQLHSHTPPDVMVGDIQPSTVMVEPISPGNTRTSP